MILFFISVPFIKILLPVKTRWNSYVVCLQTVVRIAPALKKLREEEDALFEGLIPSDRQLQSFSDMLQPLLMIKQTSEMLERETKPTLHLVLPMILKLTSISRSSKFKTSSLTTQKVIQVFEAAMNMRLKDHGRTVMAVNLANLLHPSFKGSLLNVHGKEYYDETVGYIKTQFPEVDPDASQQDKVISANHSEYYFNRSYTVQRPFLYRSYRSYIVHIVPLSFISFLYRS
jgi:hypothetical protein